MLGLIGWFWQVDCVEIKEHVCCGRVFVIIQRGDLMDKASLQILLEVLSAFRK